MPHYYNENGNNILVVTYDELVPMFYSSVEYLRKLVCLHQKKGYGIRKIQRGGGCETQALLVFDSLPRRIREQMDDPRKGKHILESYYRIDTKAGTYFREDFQFEDGSYIKDDVADKYIAIASVLNAVIELREDRLFDRQTKSPKKNPKYLLWQSLADDVKTFLPVLKKKYETDISLPEHPRRLQEEVEKYEKDGYKSILSGHHFTKNYIKVDDKTKRLFESIFTQLGYKLNYLEAYEIYTSFVDGKTEIVNNNTGELLNPKEYEHVSDATVRNYLSKWESRVATSRLRLGDRQKHMGLYKVSHKMDNKGYAGSLISIDDRQPPFEYAPSQRVWFYLAQDPASESITTWVYGKSKEGIIVDFYRQMVRNYATWGLCLPAELECESSLNSTFRNTLLREGNMFPYVRMEANNARGKYIESGGNKKLRYGGEKEQQGWLARPFARLEANQSGTEQVPRRPYQDIINICLKEIENFNNMPHSIQKEKTRWEVFLESQNPSLQPINWRGILPYIGYKTQTSCNVGVIRLQNSTYLLAKNGEISTGNELIQLMSLIEGEQIDVYWLDDNDGNLMKAIAYIGNQFICELLPQPVYKRARIEQTDEDLKARETMSKYVMTVESFAKSRQHEIEGITIVKEAPKTLNNTFNIFNPAMSFSSQIEEKGYREVEVLPDIEEELEYELSSFETPIKKSLYDRF